MSIYSKCVSFAMECYETNKEEYSRRNQNNKNVIISQIAQGKYAEILAQNILEDLGYSIIRGADFEIYDKYNKSFDADLIVHKEDEDPMVKHIHVKSISHESANRYGASWLFQKKDKMFITPRDNELGLFIVLDRTGFGVSDYVIRPTSYILSRVSVPRIERLRDTKHEIYLKDLK